MAKNFKKALKLKKFLIILLLLGLLLRLVLSVQIYSGDVNNHIAWAKDSLNFGFSGIYDREFYQRYGTLAPNYPPLPIFFFTFFHSFYNLVYKTAWDLNLSFAIFPSGVIPFLEDQDTLPAFLKIPSILADLGISVVVFMFAQKLVKNRKSKWPNLSAVFILFNPAFFYNSASWGQVEAIPIFFALASFYLLLYSKKYIFSSLFFTLALLSKQTATVFLPLFVFIFLKKFGFTKSLKAFLASLPFFWLTFLPFYKEGNLLVFPFLTYWQKIQTASVSDYVTDHAFNLWFLLGFNKVSDLGIFAFGLSFRMVGFIVFGFVLLVTLFIICRRKFSTPDVLQGAAIIAFAAFLFLTRMHERHLEQALPFLLLAGLKNNKILGIFFITSLFHFVNLYHNWWAPRVTPLVELLSQKIVIDTLILVAISSFFLLFVQYLKNPKND